MSQGSQNSFTFNSSQPSSFSHHRHHYDHSYDDPNSPTLPLPDALNYRPGIAGGNHVSSLLYGASASGSGSAYGASSYGAGGGGGRYGDGGGGGVATGDLASGGLSVPIGGNRADRGMDRDRADITSRDLLRCQLRVQRLLSDAVGHLQVLVGAQARMVSLRAPLRVLRGPVVASSRWNRGRCARGVEEVAAWPPVRYVAYTAA